LYIKQSYARRREVRSLQVYDVQSALKRCFSHPTIEGQHVSCKSRNHQPDYATQKRIEPVAFGLGHVELRQGAGIDVYGDLDGQPRLFSFARFCYREWPPITGGVNRGILRRKSTRPRKGFAFAGRGGTNRAAALPRSVIVTSCPFRTSAIRADRFCRASRMPASFMATSCYM